MAILLLFLYVFGATDAYQLLKLPLFIQHYAMHKKQAPLLSITGFMQIHYNDGLLVVDDDFEQDMQLPFKTCEVSFGQLNNIIIPNGNSMHFFREEVFDKTFFSFKQQLYCLLGNKTIFQPPRNC